MTEKIGTINTFLSETGKLFANLVVQAEPY